MHSVLSDPRTRTVRSPNCPNDIRRDEDDTGKKQRAGLCGSCAWGFFTFDSAFAQTGEPVRGLKLRKAVFANGGRAGYKSQCGRVELYFDQHGRLGALRDSDGVPGFFPGIVGNFAFERYLRAHPDLHPVEVSDARAA